MPLVAFVLSWWNCFMLHIAIPYYVFMLEFCISFLLNQIICTVWKHIMAGGPKRLPFTVPPLVFSALKVCSFWVGFFLYPLILFENMIIQNWGK